MLDVTDAGCDFDSEFDVGLDERGFTVEFDFESESDDLADSLLTSFDIVQFFLEACFVDNNLDLYLGDYERLNGLV